ncbi:hypothetical protein D3C78_898140 [compost metagenome]
MQALAVAQLQAIAAGFALDALQAVLQIPAHPQLGQRGLQPLAGLGRQQARHRPLAEANDADLEAAGGQIVGEFATDQAVAENGHPALAGQLFAEPPVVLEVVDADQRIALALDHHAQRRGTAGQHQLAVVHHPEAGVQLAGLAVDPLHFAMRVDADVQPAL